MKKITVFGKPGGGKSTLSREISACIGIEVYSLDLIKYKQNGEQMSAEEYSNSHEKLIAKESWIIEGLGTLESFWLRIDEADTIVYIDLPYRIHYWWIIKRLLKSCFVKPIGWPKESSIIKGTFLSYKYLRLSPEFWTLELFNKIKLRAKGKDIYQIKSLKELNEFVNKNITKKSNL